MTEYVNEEGRLELVKMMKDKLEDDDFDQADQAEISEEEHREMIEEKREKMRTFAELVSDENVMFALEEKMMDINQTGNDIHAPMSPSNARDIARLLLRYADEVEAIGYKLKNNRYPDDYPDRDELESVKMDEYSEVERTEADDGPDVSGINSAADW